VPFLAFAANFLWVMILGLFGPALPALIAELGIGYAQAGLFFTLLSLGSLVATPLGAAASDYLNGKLILLLMSLFLAAGLLAVSMAASFALLVAIIGVMSLLGSPIGSVSQSLMLAQFPGKRSRYLALMGSCAAAGSLLAPLLVSLNLSVGLGWRGAFAETGALGLLLAAGVLTLRLPAGAASFRFREVGAVLSHPRVRLAAVLLFFSVAPDMGFAYWLAEYASSELYLSLELASAAVGIYLAGLITGRILTSVLVRRLSEQLLLKSSLLAAPACLLVLLLVPVPGIKAAALAVYGLSIGPHFPLIMSLGTRCFPKHPGLVTGVLFGALSAGGMVFPLLLGAVAAWAGLGRSYLLLALILFGLWALLRRAEL
jgi:FHS family glucose/mannose:H+ symporter-like MFS transporter